VEKDGITMLYYAVTIKDNIITAVHESASVITSDMFAGTEYEGQEVITVPGGVYIEAGRHVQEYTSDWVLKPLSQRAAEGYFIVPDGYELVGDALIKMPEETQEPTPPTQEELDMARIEELKALLDNTDYRIIKCYEYSLLELPLPYDIQALHEQRQSWRDEIDQIREIHQW